MFLFKQPFIEPRTTRDRQTSCRQSLCSLGSVWEWLSWDAGEVNDGRTSNGAVISDVLVGAENNVLLAVEVGRDLDSHLGWVIDAL